MDRLSELPDSLIFEIFWWLPMRDVVGTTLLSKRWRNLWKTGPYLNFEGCLIQSNIDGLRSFISIALMLWRGIKILKFKIDLSSNYLNHQAIYSDVGMWLLIATEYGVQELLLDLGRREHWWDARYLRSCSSLTTLDLKCWSLDHIVHNNVMINWNKLTYLRIDCCELCGDMINRVLSGSPNLQVLVMLLSGHFKKLTIQSTSLKHLCVQNNYSHNFSKDNELRISTPNLEVLAMLGFPFYGCFMDNAPCLTRANMAFDRRVRCVHHSGRVIDLVERTLSQILPTIHHVKELKLSDCCIKAFGDVMRNYNMHCSSFPNVSLLDLQRCFREYEEIVHLLESFPDDLNSTC